MQKIINKLHSFKFFGFIFHTLPYCLTKELADCETVLDLGCGPLSPIKDCKNIKYSVGVEIFKPYLDVSKKHKIHSKYLNKKIEEINFKEGSFDAVLMIEVLEHLTAEEGLIMIKKASKWSRNKVIITSPNGFISQGEIDSNSYQKHLSGWDYIKMKDMGFKIQGLAGLKCLRREVGDKTMGDNLLNSIKYRPKVFWFIVATLSQLVTYYFPDTAFELFCVKYKP